MVSILALIYFFYGLAFYSLGLGTLLEGSHCSDRRLRHALRPLAAFGFVHGTHEWIEMIDKLGVLQIGYDSYLAWEALRLMLLAFSFLSLAAFGSSLLAPTVEKQRYSLLSPLLLASLWSIGLFIMRGIYPLTAMPDVMDVWSRYVLAIPASIATVAGLLVQQRRFRQVGLARFGRDALWAAVAFLWYGWLGQSVVRSSLLPPSNIWNQDVFLAVFGFPVQILRAIAAVTATLFVLRFMRAFEVEIRHKLDELQEARLIDAHKREQLRGDLLMRVVDAQEAERQRIARELHDETGQTLTALGLGLRGVGTLLHQDPLKAAHNLRHLEGMTAAALVELQHLIADLRPSHLDDLGLAATLRWYAADLRNRVPLQVDVEIDGERRQELPPAMTTALFRIAQEALNNTIKHAFASHAWVRLHYDSARVKLQIEDDGCGFEWGANPRHASWGLDGMRERATLLGGTFHISSSPGQGTLVEVDLPYHPSPGDSGGPDEHHSVTR